MKAQLDAMSFSVYTDFACLDSFIRPTFAYTPSSLTQ